MGSPFRASIVNGYDSGVFEAGHMPGLFEQLADFIGF
jgi:hypothetical protein